MRKKNKFIKPIFETKEFVIIDKKSFKQCLTYVTKIKKENKELKWQLKNKN